jgi:hypothetical protein
VKPLKNHSIYHGLSTYSHRNPVTFHPQITKKSTLEPVLQLCYPKSRKNHKSYPKVGPKRVQKSIRNRSKSRSAPQGVHWVSPWTPRSPKWCPRYQKWSLNVCKMTVAGIKSDPWCILDSQVSGAFWTLKFQVHFGISSFRCILESQVSGAFFFSAVNQSTSQPVNQSTSQPVDQSTSQPVAC